MAETMVSPGVFTQENDLSFLPTGISAIGAAIIGPTDKGPAFIPTVVTSANEYVLKFGSSNTYYTDYTVKSYLKSAGTVTIVRVLGTTSYARKLFTIELEEGATSTPYNGKILAVFGASGSDSVFSSVTCSGDITDFILKLDGSDSTAYSASFDSRKSNYITNVFTGTNPVQVVYNFPTVQSASIASVSSSANAVTGSTEWSSDASAVSMSSAGYAHASSPWIESQNMASSLSSDATYYQLFKFHTLSDGTSANREIKVGIFNIKPASEVPNSDYGTFSVVVRKYSDVDNRVEASETFNNATLDPDSINYLPRLIGDRKAYYRTIGGESRIVFEGDWPNKSDYIRVEMNTTSFPKSSVPMGFAPYYTPFIDSDATAFVTMSYVTSQTLNGETNTRVYRGVNFSDRDVDAYFNELGATLDIAGSYTNSTGSNVRFNLSSLSDVISYSSSGSEWSTDVNRRKFIFGFQGGSNGQDPRTPILKGESISATNIQGFNCNTASTGGSVAYKRAIDSVANPDEIDINMIVLPGILKKYHSYVTTYATNICEERGDCFFIMDVAGLTDSITDTISEVTSLDSNYVATYYPWVKVFDNTTAKPLWVPPTVVMAGVISFSDSVSQEWFAPAGLTRGGIPGATEAYTRLTHVERDTLYNARINPIATFPGAGVTVWGQKTLQAKASALDRINVRRLLIALKKFIASSSKYLVFEQNTNTTRNSFLGIVEPYLDSVVRNSGLYAYRVVMDDSNNSADVIDRNQLVGDIYLQPTRTAEFIKLNFNVMPTGATFPE